jgi:hypothetical protein
MRTWGMTIYNTNLYRWFLYVAGSLLYINVGPKFGVGLSIGNVQVTRTLLCWTAWSVVGSPVKRVGRQILKIRISGAMIAPGLPDLEPWLLDASHEKL